MLATFFPLGALYRHVPGMVEFNGSPLDTQGMFLLALGRTLTPHTSWPWCQPSSPFLPLVRRMAGSEWWLD